LGVIRFTAQSLLEDMGATCETLSLGIEKREERREEKREDIGWGL
jgi:hypothetical protein